MLIVNDDEDLARFAAKILKRHGGHTAEVTLSPKDSLDLVAKNNYDAVLIEFRIPRKEVGMNLAKMLRDRGYKGLLVAFVTMPHTFTVENMIAHGFNTCIEKSHLLKQMDMLETDPNSTRFEGDDLVYEKDKRFDD